jgi:hypothetical protein
MITIYRNSFVLPLFFLGSLGLLLMILSCYLRSLLYSLEMLTSPQSVPPLYHALERIWTWIDDEVPVPSVPTALHKSFGARTAWWELLVTRVQAKEEETLCLT